MDSRTARRAAEKAARDLMNSRATLVGELAVTNAERARLTEDIAAATARGRQLIADAQADAARLVAAAQDLAADGEQRYADAYSAATAAGWATDDLAALGYQPAQSTTRLRRRQPSPVDQAPVATDRADTTGPAAAHQPDVDTATAPPTPAPT